MLEFNNVAVLKLTVDLNLSLQLLLQHAVS
jgi:hypothetical protein